MPSFQEHGDLRNKWGCTSVYSYADINSYDEDERAEFGVNTYRNERILNDFT
jgi:hypothetical protein